MSEIKTDNQQSQSSSQGGQAQAPVATKTSGLGVAALVLGILGIVGSWVPILNNFSAILAVIGLILGIVGIVTISKSNGAKGGKGIAIAGTIISIVALIVVFASQSFYGAVLDETSNAINESTSKATGGATEELLANDVSVDFETYSVEDNTYYKTGKLNVKITNKSSETKTFNVQIEAVDASGNRIDDSYAYASNLQAGQSTTQEAFYAASDEQVTKYQNATFKVVSVSEY